MSLPDANTTRATGPEALDEDYRNAFEAAIEHYIQSFLQMNHPRAEAKIELKNLQLQWTRLCSMFLRPPPKRHACMPCKRISHDWHLLYPYPKILTR